MADLTSGNELSPDDAWCYEAWIYSKGDQGNFISFNTKWVGYADAEQRIELRQPRRISRNDLIANISPFTGTKIENVESKLQLASFWICGGHAAIDAVLAEAEIPHHLGPKPMTSSTDNGPFYSLSVPIEVATTRAPSRKLRMSILKRDEYRCKICGQRPSEDPNVILHVHHIRPWNKNGATVPMNLITLCHTCHMGLDPHYNRELAWLVKDPYNIG